MSTEKERIEKEAHDTLYRVMDPEIGINIVDLGLIYEIEYRQEDESIRVEMTLTTDGCPMGDVIQQDVQYSLEHQFPNLRIELELTFDPPWSIEMISEEGRDLLG